MSTSRNVFIAVAVLVLAAVASPAAAQAWRGAPLFVPATGANLLAGFPDGYDMYGAEVFSHFGAVTAGLEYGLASYGDDIPSSHTGALNLALRLPLPTEASGLVISPVASPSYTKWEDDNWIQVPVGASVSFAIPAGAGMAVIPYAIPQFVWSRYSHEDHSDTSSDFGYRAGGNLVVNNLTFGVGYHKVGDGDGMIGINVGALFR